MPAIPGSGRPRNLILTAMIFAVSMTFIDMTIISIAVPPIQRDLGLSTTGVQWAVNGYLLTLAALFAFGGRLADTVGHRAMVMLGVIVFAAAYALCGLTPRGGIAGDWLVTFRAVQGAGGALLYPAALGIVIQTFPLRQRGRALALFFGAAGALTVFLVIAGIMAAAALVACTGLRAGRQEEPGEAGPVPGSQAPHEEARARP